MNSFIQKMTVLYIGTVVVGGEIKVNTRDMITNISKIRFSGWRETKRDIYFLI